EAAVAQVDNDRRAPAEPEVRFLVRRHAVPIHLLLPIYVEIATALLRDLRDHLRQLAAIRPDPPSDPHRMDFEHWQEDLAVAQRRLVNEPIPGACVLVPIRERDLAGLDRQGTPRAVGFETPVELRAERQRTDSEKAFPHPLLPRRRLRLEQPAMERELVAHHHAHRLIALVSRFGGGREVWRGGDEVILLL